MNDYLPVGLLLILAVLILIGMAVLGRLLTSRPPRRRESSGAAPTEKTSGSLPFSVIALLFISLDIAAVFIIPWALLFRRFGLGGLLAMAVFLGLPMVGLLYAWRKGDLRWQ